MSEDGIQLTGRVPDHYIRLKRFTRPDADLVNKLRNIKDLTGTLSDVMDEMGLVQVVPASVMRGNMTDGIAIGPAVTVRNIAQDAAPGENLRLGRNGLAEVEGLNLSLPGDVLVIQGLERISNMGGVMATIANRQGLVGAVIDGAYRDDGRFRELSFPVWSKGASPITGKWRVQTVEINGPVQIAGVRVEPGDLVVADQTGICVIPLRVLPQVVERTLEIALGEDSERIPDIESGMPIPDLARKKYGYSKPRKWELPAQQR